MDLHFGFGGKPFEHSVPANITTVLVANLVDGHPADPTHRVVVGHDRPPPQVGLDECVLDGVGCGLLVSAHHGEGANKSPMVGAEERLKIIDHTCVVHQGSCHHI